MKQWVKSRTMWAGFLIGLLGLAQAALQTAPLDPGMQGYIFAGIGALIMFLRTITNKALADK